jgi:nucleotide-binding universal stress UspA family protein
MAFLLVCTDGSVYATSIYQHAAWAAQRLGMGIELLHVIEHHREQSATLDLSGAIGMDAGAELTEELVALEERLGRAGRLRGKAILEEGERQLIAAGVAQVRTIQRHGTLVETLEELEPNAELVVVGKRGEHADFVRGHLGSNLEDLVRISVRPVLVAARTFHPIRRYLMAFDDSPSARKAVTYVAGSLLLKGLEGHLMMVGKAGLAPTSALERARQELVQAGHPVTATLKPGSAGKVIAEEVKTLGIDLLVMGAYGHSVIREFMVGSTTTKMVRTCPIPVLMIR